MNYQTKTSPTDHSDKTVLEFEDNSCLGLLFGQHDEHLVRLEHSLDISIASRGNRIVIEGTMDARLVARDILMSLYEKARKGNAITMAEVDAMIRNSRSPVDEVAVKAKPAKSKAEPGGDAKSDVSIKTKKKVITPYSPTQAHYMRHLKNDPMIFACGPAGTGKTYLAVAMAVEKMITGEIDRIILSRPAVEAGENLGFLPGDMKEKVDPYLRPLYDALYQMLPEPIVERKFASGEIEIAPLAFMRGRTLSDAFVILDEAQNTTPMQMKMFLTRFGENCRMVIAGDPTQVDLPKGQQSGLIHATQTLKSVEDITVVNFSSIDVVRHPLVGKIVEAYKAAPDV